MSILLGVVLAFAQASPSYEETCADPKPGAQVKVCKYMKNIDEYKIRSVDSIAAGTHEQMLSIRPQARVCGVSNRIDYVGTKVSVFDIINADDAQKACVVSWVEDNLPTLKFAEQALSSAISEDRRYSAVPAPSATPITIGEQYQLEALGEQRNLNVILPAGYNDDPEKRWPVIYMLDGGMQQDLMLVSGLERWNRLWGRSQHAIVVGIETKDRQRELLPVTNDPAEQKQYPTAGENSAFRGWIAGQVKPLVEQAYRTNGTDILVGESAAGHFVVETWMNSNEMFDGYAAISPSMQWDNQVLARQITGPVKGKPPLFLSLADEGGATEEGIMKLADAMGETQDFCFSDRRNDLVHANSLHGLLPEALQYLLPTEADWLADYGLKLRCDRTGQSEDG